MNLSMAFRWHHGPAHESVRTWVRDKQTGQYMRHLVRRHITGKSYYGSLLLSVEGDRTLCLYCFSNAVKDGRCVTCGTRHLDDEV